MTIDLYEHYKVVLDDLSAQRDRLEAEMAEVESAIAAIQRRLGPGTVTVPQVANESGRKVDETTTKPKAQPKFNYANMSVRWAVLGFLAEELPGGRPLGTGAIAEALQERGLTKQGPSRFGNIVSAVISHLKAKGEVESSPDGGYRLTPAGASMWQHIRTSAKFRQTQDPSYANGRGLLDGR